ncbi:CTP synthase [Spironucleus salmonicida]|uniref:CTP synthase n=1 Tax=Spironucleus salmonicida TaxID=348837 RepID=V6LKW5_9EUKA|nr:CTP synthase [Spironucleus salmonicida]|eukprot:EST44381.1 CTP synthase [Spironucleus salmonicida]
MKWIIISSDAQSSCKTAISSYIAAILDHNQIKINYIKLNPALTVKMGLVSPDVIGEVFITHDGAQTDKDIGIIERSLSYNLPSHSFLSLGQSVNHVNLIETSSKSSGFDFLSVDEQLVDYIYHYISNFKEAVINIIEIGGSINDQAGLIFARSIMKLDQINNISSIHLGLDESSFVKVFKKPPTLFINFNDFKSQLSERKINSNIANSLKNLLYSYLNIRLSEFDQSHTYLHLIKKTQHKNTVKIALVGRHVNNLSAYLSVVDNLRAAAQIVEMNIEFIPLNSKFLTQQNIETNMKNIESCILLDGFGDSGHFGKRISAKYCREHKIPLLGICQGAYQGILEFAQSNNIENWEQVIKPIDEDEQGNIIGDKEISVLKNSLAEGLFKNDKMERFYTVNNINNEVFKQLEQFGMIGTVFNKAGTECKCAELKDHPMYILCSFLPQFNGRYNQPHEVFIQLIMKGWQQRGQCMKE